MKRWVFHCPSSILFLFFVSIFFILVVWGAGHFVYPKRFSIKQKSVYFTKQNAKEKKE